MISCFSQINDAGKICVYEKDHYETKPYDYKMLGIDQIAEIEERVDFSSNKYEYLTLYSDFQVMIPVSEDKAD